MAVLQADFLSRSLNRFVTFHAVVPIEGAPADGGPAAERSGKLKTLYLLHGWMGNSANWLTRTRIQLYAETYRIAVIMPSGENSFYLDDPQKGEFFSRFIGEELVNFTRSLFPLSERREDTAIGGLSMGGYGALRNGFLYPDTFGQIVALSAALVAERAAQGQETLCGTVQPDRLRYILGKDSAAADGGREPGARAKYLMERRLQMPAVFMACGADDFLLQDNRAFHSELQTLRADVTYVEAPGSHDWFFWDTQIERALCWLSKRNQP